MILLVLRILFGAGLAYGFVKVLQNEQTAPQTGDLTNAFYLALCVILAVANGVVWAPVLGEAISEPLTGVMTKSTYVDRKNHLLRFVHWLENRGLRRWTLFFCFLEGIRCPHRPAAFVIGLNNARPGSWLEKIYALELFKFDNAQHCMMAYEALRRRGINPRPHHNPEVNLVLLTLDREVRPAPEPIPVPPAAPAPPPKRDRRIRLFATANPDAVAMTANPPTDIAADGPAVSGESTPAAPTERPTDAREDHGAPEAAEAAGEKEAEPGLAGRLRAFFRGG